MYVHAHVSRETGTRGIDWSIEDEGDLAKPKQPARSRSNERCCRAFRTFFTYTLMLFPFLAS
jgi:hypothetical protein